MRTRKKLLLSCLIFAFVASVFAYMATQTSSNVSENDEAKMSIEIVTKMHQPTITPSANIIKPIKVSKKQNPELPVTSTSPAIINGSTDQSTNSSDTQARGGVSTVEPTPTTVVSIPTPTITVISQPPTENIQPTTFTPTPKPSSNNLVISGNNTGTVNTGSVNPIVGGTTSVVITGNSSSSSNQPVGAESENNVRPGNSANINTVPAK